MNRERSLERACRKGQTYDLLVIGGGATGAGIALDARSRGLDTLLLERADFGIGTSSRSTKLVHGGVRYLAQGRIGLVLEALRERGTLRRNAPALVTPQAFVLPVASRFEQLKFGFGLACYDWLAHGSDLPRTRALDRDALAAALPNFRSERFRGGYCYFDGQFDDARFLLAVLMRAAGDGADIVNYAEVMAFRTNRAGRIDGAEFVDHETGATHVVAAHMVVNAAGPYVDSVHRLAAPAAPPLVRLSRGSHLVVSRDFLPGTHALLVPKTPDGRVMFAVPWLGHTLLGTTDVATDRAEDDPLPAAEEVDQILAVTGAYLRVAPDRSAVTSAFAGLRPLAAGSDGATARLSREHRLHVTDNGLVSVVGGKWTTYRSMAADCVESTARHHGIHIAASHSADLALSLPAAAAVCAADASAPLVDGLPYTAADALFAVRQAMARRVADVLARRTRALFLDARAASAAAPRVAGLMAAELGRDALWAAREADSFQQLARRYMIAP